MIDRAAFHEQFQYFDTEVVIEVVDLFLTTHQEQLDGLRNSIADDDLESVNMHAHSLKGLAGTFAAPEAREIALALEEMARNKRIKGMSDLFIRLEIAIKELAADLREIRDQELS